MSGVSSKALRLYDGLKLFAPAWVDPHSGYRFYSPAQLPEIRRIVALRDTGMALAEIRDALRGGRDLRDALADRREVLERERREVERRLAALDIRVGAETADTDGPDVVVRTVPREPVATLAISRVADGDVSKAFYELEVHVRDHGRRAHRPPGALIPQLGSADPSEVEVYVPLTRPLEPGPRIGYRLLPPARVATVLQRGRYTELGVARRGLERWVASTGLAQDGPLRVLYLQFGAEPELGVPRGWVVEDPSDYVTELQLPLA